MTVNVIKELSCNSSVIDIEVVGDFLIAIDNAYNVYYIKQNTLEIDKSVCILKKIKPKHSFLKSSSISKCGTINVGLSDSNKSLYLSHKDKDLLKEKLIDFHQKEVEQSKFSKCSSFVATGGADGKVFVFDTNYLSYPLASLATEADFISSLAFSKDSSKLISSSFKKVTTIFDFDMNINIARFTTSDVVEDARFFDNNKKILLIQKDGNALIYDMKCRQIVSKVAHFSEWPTTIELSEDEQFAIIGTRKSKIYLIRLKDNKKITTLDMKNIGITTIKLFSNYIFMGFSDGKIKIIDYKYGEKELELKLKIKHYKDAKRILDTNVFLYFSNLLEVFENAWGLVLKKAISLISRDKLQEAVEIVAPFVDDTQRAKEFEFYISQKDSIGAFLELIDKQSFYDAMLLAEQKPYLQKLSDYEKLENFYKLVLNKAKVMLEEDAKLHKQKAISILAPFKKIKSKESMISDILLNSDKFTLADTKVKEQNFIEYFKLVEKYKFLKDTQLFDRVSQLGEKFYHQVLELINKDELQEAKNRIEKLKIFLPYKDTATALEKEIDYKLNFIEFIKTDNLKGAYNIVKEYESIKFSPLYTTLNEKFKTDCERAKEYIYETNVKQCIQILEKYKDIEYTSHKVSAIIKVGYILQIKENINNEFVDLEQSIINYCNYFGLDEDIKNMCTKHNKEELYQKIKDEVVTNIARSSISMDYIDCIIEYKGK